MSTFAAGVAVGRAAPLLATLILIVAAAALLPWAVLLVGPSRRVGERWKRGAVGEARTAQLLTPLVDDGYVVLHDLAVPRSRANIDHLVIGPTGVFVVDSKLYGRPIAWTSGDQTLHERLETTRFEARRAGELLADLLRQAGLAGVRALWCVHGAGAPVRPLAISGIAVVPATAIVQTLRNQSALVRADQVEALAREARRRFARAR